MIYSSIVYRIEFEIDMNRIKINMNNLKYEGWLLGSISDLEDYRESTDKLFKKGVQAIISNHIPIERYDHIANKTEFGGILLTASHKAAFECASPLIELGKMYDRKTRNMYEMIQKGHKLIINDIGGYCTITHDDYEIVKKYEKEKHFFVNTNTRYINIENDPWLEKYTTDHLTRLDKNYSHITQARNLDKNDLMEIFTKFKANGGIGIWQYTTAMDIKQLYMFINIGIESGLTEFIVNFNNGRNIDIDELIIYYKSIPTINFTANFV